MGMPWSKCPTWWIMGKGLKKLVGNKKPGDSLAALKCLVAISVGIDFHTCKVKMSISGFEEITGLSKPKVIKGISILESLSIVEVDRNDYINEYRLTEGDDHKGWAKLPVHQIRINLSSVSNRGIASLAALKIYLVLAAVRINTKEDIHISYETLIDYTGLQRRHIRAGLSVLYSAALVHSKPPGEESNSNEYFLKGLTIKH